MKEDIEDTQEAQAASEVTETEEEQEQKEQGTQEKPLETMPTENRSVPSQTSQTPITQEQLQNYILNRLVEGASYREVAKETSIPKTTIHKYFPKAYVDSVRLNLQKQEAEAQALSHTPPIQQRPQQPIYQEPLDRSVLPHGSIVLTPQMISNIRSGLNATQQRHFDMAMNIASQYQDQLLTQSQTRGQPFPQGSVEQEEAGLLRAMARRVRFRTYKDMTTDNPGNKPRSAEATLKDAADFIKFGASLVSPNKQENPLNIYRSGREDAKGDLAHMGKSGETNLTDLRLEELRQGHDIDMQRISFEQKKFFLGLQNEEKKWDRITEVFGPILQSAGPEIRKAIRQVGENVGRGFAGATKPNVQPNMVETSCPKCNSPLNIPIPEEAKGSVNVKCPKCGEMFQMTQDEEETEERTELRPKSGRLGSRYT